jgi:hypothetical protein
MATHFACDDREAALKLYQVNHLLPEGMGDEFFFWKNSQGLAAIPTGRDSTGNRDTAIVNAAAALGVTLTTLSPWEREAEFWAGWLAKPPTALP